MTRDAHAPGHLLALEMLASNAYGETDAVTEVIRPSAVLPEKAALRVVSELSVRDARTGGVWVAEPTSWRRYTGPWNGPGGDTGDAELLGTIQVAYGTPGRYDITVFRVTITEAGAADGWTVERLCDEAFSYGDLTLARCPRTALVPPPRPFRIR